MSTELTITEDQQNWTPQQKAALVQIGVDRATEGDLSVFFHQCQRTGLDPFARQIYMIGRNTRVKVWNQQTGREEWQDVYSIARDLGIEMDYDWNCRCWRTVSDRVGAQLEEHIRELREI